MPGEAVVAVFWQELDYTDLLTPHSHQPFYCLQISLLYPLNSMSLEENENCSIYFTMQLSFTFLLSGRHTKPVLIQNLSFLSQIQYFLTNFCSVNLRIKTEGLAIDHL